MNKDIYALLQEIEQCGYSAERAHDIAENMDSEEMEEIREKLEIISLELCELKSNLREKVRRSDGTHKSGADQGDQKPLPRD